MTKCSRFVSLVSPVFLAAALATQGASAQVLAEFDPLGPQGSSAGVFATAIAPGLTISDLTQTGFTGWGNTNRWPVGQLAIASPTVDLTRYVSFSVDAASAVTYTSLTYSRFSYLGDGNRAAALRSSVDAFATDLAVVTGLIPDGMQQIDFDLTGVAPTVGPVEFRLYFYDAPVAGMDWVDLLSTAAGGSGLVLSGSVSDDVGMNYCVGNPNSTGVVAEIDGSGTTNVADNDLTLGADGLPAFSFSFFIVSNTQGFIQNPAGSQGNLCLGGAVGRYVGPGQVQQAGLNGRIELPLDLTMVPQPLGFVSVMAGDVWNFQAWYRDSINGMPTSNFTNGLTVSF